MKKKYFLYIDILGFANLVTKSPEKIKLIYEIINSLNVHKHHAFKTIVFSDTILVYNKIDPESDREHNYLVMYACEFVQELTYHLADKDIYFRAILTYDNFTQYNLENIDCYYGDALVNCYNKEKEVNGMGLFIDKNIIKYNGIFPTTSYDKDLDFVFILQSFDRLYKNTQGELPSIDLLTIDGTDEYWSIKFELKYLKNIYLNSINGIDPKIRSKYLQTYQLFKNHYKLLLTKFEDNDFNYEIINPNANWKEKLDNY